ncbi:MAG: DUF3987 domain-containing protein [Solidesulfovibrio sp.]|uniref:DUF3987 domain-containing protein n=1 Tax=Solidesulfovibrio sp. TaxID=2910990 RepID=UPI002B21E8D8|nr:DUF3987 domain-containing protein [Solidesulfovibrio sp.]MEA4856548.1 DUF3987 domain-containing protein [Solidesulfovibrio sp.]
MYKEHIDEFRAFLESVALRPADIIADGKIHRCGTVGKEQGADGSYLLYPDFPLYGRCWNFRTGEEAVWTKETSVPLSSEARAKIETARKVRQQTEDARAATARNNAQSIWGAARPAPGDHPYFIKKGVKPHGNIRIAQDGRLVVPVFDANGTLLSLQFISAMGEKRFLSGGRVRGGFFQIDGNNGPLYIAEGYATGATIHAATGEHVLVAFNCGNLLAVAKVVRQIYPNRSIIICAEDDHATAVNTGKNPGIEKATEAAMSISGLLAIPVFQDPAGKSDFNDLAATEGLEAVRTCLRAAKSVAPPRVSHGSGLAPVPFENTIPPSIPPEHVPGILRDFSLALSESLQVPFELALCNALGTVAVAAQRKIQVLIKEGYTEPLNIYALCPLPPGERKSPTVEACKGPLVEWQSANYHAMRDIILDAASERKTLEKAIEAKRGLVAKAKNDEARRVLIEDIKSMERALPEVPISPRLLADDFTPEALGMLMERHEQRIGVLEAEGGLFDTLSGRYSNGIPNLDAVLKFWSGESCQIDRRGRDSIFLDDPHLTLVISTQPEIVQGLADRPGFRGRGLIGRFLYVIPQSRLGWRSVETKPVYPGLMKLWRDTIHKLLDLPWARGTHGEAIPYDIQLDKTAYRQWQEYAASVEKELGPGGQFENMTDWAGKLPGQIIRLVGLFHVATDPDPLDKPIATATMTDALVVAAILAEHAKAAYGLMGSDPSQDCAKAILRWIKRDRVERFSARDTLEKVKGRFPTMEKVNPGLSILIERAFIFETAPEPHKGPGRKPSTTFTVNPKLWE